MIPELMIREWQSKQAPWSTATMVEQDLIISRALVNLYEQSEIRNSLVFRGGTALNKIYITPPARYSEDLDFVQIESAPIGSVIDAIRTALDGWLGEPKRKITERGVKLFYRYQSSEKISAKLKIEINTTEHYHILDLKDVNFNVNSDWYSGEANIKTYQLNELMGTKLRALYQRRKGRDLFDLWYVMQNNLIDLDLVLDVFNQHSERNSQPVTRALFEKNLYEKRRDQGFSTDMQYLIHPSINYVFDQACDFIESKLFEKLPGESWRLLAEVD